MEKIKYLIFFAIGIFLCCSCGNSDVTEKTELTTQYTVYDSEEQEYMDFQAKLEALNEQTFIEQDATRGLSRFFKKFLAVVACDALGSGIGSVGGPVGIATAAITASLAAVITPVEQIGIFTRTNEYLTGRTIGMNNAGYALANNLVPANPINGKYYTIEDSIGYYHNKVLLSLDSDISSRTLDLDTIMVKVADETYQSYKTSKTVIISNLKANQTSFDKITTNIMPNIHEAKDIATMIERFQQQYPEHAPLIRVLETFLNGLSNIKPTNNDGEYLNKALALLDTIPMRSVVRQNIQNAIIVANASYQLWKLPED